MRCFVAIPLPPTYQDGLRRAVELLQPRVRSQMRWAQPGNGHLTLKFLGDVDEVELATVRGALGGLRFSPFLLQAGGAGFFPHVAKPRVVWVGLKKGQQAVRKLAEKVEAALEPLGFAAEGRLFTPHLTVGRVKKPLRDDWLTLSRVLNGLE